MNGATVKKILKRVVIGAALLGLGYYLYTRPEQLRSAHYVAEVYSCPRMADQTHPSADFTPYNTPDGFIILKSPDLGSSAKQTILTAMKVDDRGSVAWRYQLSSLISAGWYRAKQMPNGDVVVTGYTSGSFAQKHVKAEPPEHPFVMRLSKHGKLVWQHELESAAQQIVDVSNERILLYQQTDEIGKVCLLNASGKIILQQTLSKPNREKTMRQIIRMYQPAVGNDAALSARIQNIIRKAEYGSDPEDSFAQIDGKDYTIYSRDVSANRGDIVLTRFDDGKEIDVASVSGHKGLTHAFVPSFVGSAGSLAWFTVDADAASDAMTSDKYNSWKWYSWSALYETDGHTARKLLDLGRGNHAFGYDVSYTSRSDGSYVIYAKRDGQKGNGVFYAYNASGVLISRYQLPGVIWQVQMHPHLNLIVVSKFDKTVRKLRACTMSLPTVACPTVKLINGQTLGSHQITMECTTPDADIYYTTDGKAPSRDGMRYVRPMNLDRNVKLKVGAFKPGMLPSVCREVSFKAP